MNNLSEDLIQKAVFKAVKGNDIKRLKELVAAGCNVNIRDQKGWTPIYYAFLQNNPATIQYLKEQNAMLNYTNYDGMTMLGSAIENGDSKTPRLMLKHGADPNYINQNGWRTNLNLAIIQDSKDSSLNFTGLLLERGALPNGSPLSQDKPLHEAVRCNNISATQKLLNAGADINSVNDKFQTPMMLASQKDDRYMISLMLDHHAQLHHQDVDGKTAMDYASPDIRSFFEDLLNVIAKKGTQFSLEQLQDKLVAEIQSENPNAIKISLFINLITNSGENKENMIFTREDNLGTHQTPLQMAVLNTTDEKILESIYRANPKLLNIADAEYGWTPLHLAAMHEKHKIMKYLIDAGADRTITDKNPEGAQIFLEYIRDERVRREICNYCDQKSGIVHSNVRRFFRSVNSFAREVAEINRRAVVDVQLARRTFYY